MKKSTKIIIGLLAFIAIAELGYFFAWKNKIAELEAEYKA